MLCTGLYLVFISQQEPTQKREIREINEEILAILSNRINDIFNTLFSLYPVEKSSLTNYIEFLTYNVSATFTSYILDKFYV